MPDVRISPQADDLLDALWSRGEAALVERLETAIDWIRDDDVRARAHRLEGPAYPDGAWLIVVRHAGQAWVVVWAADEAGPAVHGITTTDVF